MLDAVTLTSTTETTTAIVISSLNLLRFWRLWSGFVCGESEAKWFGGGRKGLRRRRAFANDIGCPGGYAVDGLDSKPSIPLLYAAMVRLFPVHAH